MFIESLTQTLRGPPREARGCMQFRLVVAKPFTRYFIVGKGSIYILDYGGGACSMEPGFISSQALCYLERIFSKSTITLIYIFVVLYQMYLSALSPIVSAS